MNWSLDREQKTNFFLFERETPCYSAVMSNFEIGASEAYKGQSAAESEGGGGGEHSRRNPLKNQDSEKEMKDNGTCEPGFAARRYAKSMTGTPSCKLRGRSGAGADCNDNPWTGRA
jgi:hypothetical protein